MPRHTRHEQIRLKNQHKAEKTVWQQPRTYSDEIDELLQLTCDPDPLVRKDAAQALCPCHVQFNHPQVWDRLMAMVDDPDPKVRGVVLHTLGDGSPREREAEIVAAIERMYHDPDPKLRRRVRKLLAHYRQTGKINVL